MSPVTITVIAAAAGPPSSAPLRDRTNQQAGAQVRPNDGKGSKKAVGGAHESQKKAKTPELLASEASKPTTNTPFEEYMSTFKTFMGENGFLGYVLVRGIALSRDQKQDGPESHHGEEEEGTSKFTKDQMESLRFIFLTRARVDQFAEMRDLLVGDEPSLQIGKSCRMMIVNSSFSYHVLETYDFVHRRLNDRSKAKKMTPAQKLDFLLAYTVALKDYDAWMANNRGGMGTVVKGLSSMWKRLLTKYSGKELGWDVEYSKPGVMELLRQFKEKVALVPDHNELGKFQFM
jgi:hypothetical protein